MDTQDTNPGILVATGGSVHSDIALACAAQLAAQCRLGLTVLTVVRPKEGRRRADAVQERVKTRTSSLVPDDRVTMRIRTGRPAERIVAEAQAGRYLLAVVGERHHHSLWTRYVLGPVSQQVIEHASCPVIVAKGKVGPIRSLLICDSGYPDRPLVPRVLDQLSPVLAVAQTITVLHVMSQMAAGPSVEARDLEAVAEELVQEHSPEGELLARDRRLLADAGFAALVKVRHGLVIDEILVEAREGDHDLVIVGAHPGEGWRRILLDDVTRQVVAGLDRPVAVVR